MVLYFILLSSFVHGACKPPIYGGQLVMGCSGDLLRWVGAHGHRPHGVVDRAKAKPVM
jgi:hypothetical protein